VGEGTKLREHPQPEERARGRWRKKRAVRGTGEGHSTHVPPTSSSIGSAPVSGCPSIDLCCIGCSSSREHECGDGSGSSRMGSCDMVGSDGRGRGFFGMLPK
jgi:hypothetical protein